MLGEISSSEVKEVNGLFGGLGVMFFAGKSEPASLHAIATAKTAFFFGAGGMMGLYGKFVKGYSFLWLGAAILPGSLYLMTQFMKPQETTLQNAYRYLLAKRAASCEMEANASAIATSDFATTAEYAAL